MSNHQHNQYARDNDPSGTQHHILIYIEQMLCGEYPDPQEHSIFKVRHQLRKVNEKAYEPEILSIGPYHYGKDKFKTMEEQKVRYMKQLLLEKEESINRFMPTLMELEEPARHCYAETIDHLSQEKFLAMMLIDGCFIVELFREYPIRKLGDRDDPLMKSDWILRDLLLLENQLPLFVLNELYDLIKAPNETPDLIDVATGFFNFEPGDLRLDLMLGESKHLLHLMHTCWTAGLTKVPQYYCVIGLNMFVKMKKLVPTATKLRDYGVKLRGNRSLDLMHIKFENGILEMPVLMVKDDTESLIRNLIAYEQHCHVRDINYVTDYMSFMDGLIDSSKDVKLLRQKGIIKNYLGNDEVVAQMFNKMGDSITLSDFYYHDISNKLNMYRKTRLNVWMAKLRREYFNSPWAFFSVHVAAIVLLLLTVAQTVFTILSYAKQS